jgi:hypothetical protein
MPPAVDQMRLRTERISALPSVQSHGAAPLVLAHQQLHEFVRHEQLGVIDDAGAAGRDPRMAALDHEGVHKTQQHVMQRAALRGVTQGGGRQAQRRTRLQAFVRRDTAAKDRPRPIMPSKPTLPTSFGGGPRATPRSAPAARTERLKPRRHHAKRHTSRRHCAAEGPIASQVLFEQFEKAKGNARKQ